MFNKKEFKENIVKEINLDIEEGVLWEKLWTERLNMITIDKNTFEEFIEYMKKEMTGIEYIYLSEISDEIADKMPSYEFIEAYKALAKKYPEETKKGYIDGFIKDAEEIVKDRLG